MYRYACIFFYFLYTINLFGQWSQVGSNLFGESFNDNFGQSVSISGNGKIIAIGAPLNDGGGTDKGHVRLYKNIMGSWTQLGFDIDGETNLDRSGSSISLSDDGLTVAIGAPNNAGGGTQRGHVRVYKFINNNWQKIGNDIDGEADNDLSGNSLAISGDGNTLIIGAQYNNAAGTDRGHIRVFSLINGSWVKLGNDIDGQNNFDEFGIKVDISFDGTTIIVGSKNYDGEGVNRGLCRVYRWQNNAWVKVGNDIDGVADNDQSMIVSISGNGSIIAIGAPFHNHNGIDKGEVRVFKLFNNNWVKLGADLNGLTDNERFGVDVNLSYEGDRLGVVSYYSVSLSPIIGLVSNFKLISGNWQEVGQKITNDVGAAPNSVALSANGENMIVGSVYSVFQSNGRANVYNNAYDFNFANNGVYINNNYQKANAILHDKNEQTIFSAGYLNHSSNLEDILILKQNNSGSVDPQFGEVTTSLPNNQVINDIAQLEDGKLILTYYYSSGINQGSSVIRKLNPYTGLFDLSYNNGSNVLNFADNVVSQKVKVLNDGKLLVTGYCRNGTNTEDAFVARLLSNGVLDVSFNNIGYKIIDYNNGADFGYDIDVQSDGKMIVVGKSVIAANSDILIFRLNVNGDLDLSFDSDGFKLFGLTPSEFDEARAIKIIDENYFFVGGTSFSGLNRDFVLLKFNDSANLDLSFNNLGYVTKDISGSNDQANSMIIQNNGSIILAGKAMSSGISKLAVVKFLKNSTIDYNFANSGLILLSPSGFDSEIADIFLQNDNKILACGYTNDVLNNPRYLVARFNNNEPEIGSKLIDPNVEGGFENGNTFSANGWTVANGAATVNNWFVSNTPGINFTNTNAAFISNSPTGSFWTYNTSNNSVVHFFKDITFPSGENGAKVSFKWKCLGESGAYDAFMVSIAETDFTPVPLETNLGLNGLNGEVLTIGQFYNKNSINYDTLHFPPGLINNCDSAATVRLIFSWKNDNTLGSQPPIALDDIEVVSFKLQQQELPIIQNFQTYDGNNSSNFGDWFEAIGQHKPNVKNSSWSSKTGLSESSNISTKVNLYTDAKRDWLVLPQFQCLPNSNLNFKVAITDYDSNLADPERMTGTDDSINIRISIDCGLTWTTLYSFNSANTVDLTNIFQLNTISLSDYVGQDIRLAFFATEGVINDVNDYDFHIDDIVVTHLEAPILGFNFNVSTCDFTTNTYNVAYNLTLDTSIPTTGNLTIKDSRGVEKIYSAPFPSIISDSLSNIFSDGSQHVLSVVFSDSVSIRFDTSYFAPNQCNSNPIAYFNPYFIPNSNVESGYTQGSMSISDQGGMIYQIPIDLPPGTAGTAPSLSISYNSNGGEGIMGMGFSIDALSMISRSGNTFDVDGWNLGVMLNDFDKLSVNGERLIQTNVTSNQAYLRSSSEYITKNQNFTKYVAFGESGEEPDGFIAYTKSGEKMFFGSSLDSRVRSINGPTVFWLLKRVEDQFGNYFEYDYFNRTPSLSNPANEFYPTKIRYTGNNLVNPYIHVDFIYTNKSPGIVKSAESYNSAVLQINTKKLSQVKVTYKGGVVDTLIKQYFINYDSSLISKILRVKSIQECGMNGKCFQPTTFNWEENETQSQFSSFNVIENPIPKRLLENTNASFSNTDFNGDGLSDVIIHNLSIDSIWIFQNYDSVSYNLIFSSKISNLFIGIAPAEITQVITAGNPALHFEITDLDGDNDPDFLYIHKVNGKNRITYTNLNSDRQNFSLNKQGQFTVPSNIIQAPQPLLFYITDLDGNGLDEFFFYNTTNGNNFFYTRVVHPTIPDSVFYQKSLGKLINLPAGKLFRFLDLNGDGASELMWADYYPLVSNPDNSNYEIVIQQLQAPLTHFFSQTDSLKSYVKQYVRPFFINYGTTQSSAPPITALYFTELNGDGLPDLAMRENLQNNLLGFYINNGQFNFIKRGTYTDTLNIPIFADYNNDGRFDVILFETSSGKNKWIQNLGFGSVYGNIQFGLDPVNNRIPKTWVNGCIPQLMSFRSNSFKDLLWVDECNTNVALRGRNRWWKNDFKPSYRVNEITNGLGSKNKVIYALTNDSNVYSPYLNNDGILPSIIFVNLSNLSYQLQKIEPFEYTGRMPVVKDFLSDNGFNGFNKTSYRYQQAIMDRSGSGFRGFGRIITKDETSKLITVKNNAITTYGLFSEYENYTFFEGDDFFITKTITEDTILSKNIQITSTYLDTIIISHNYESFFEYNKTSIKINHDLDGTFASEMSMYNKVDTFGNVILNVVNYNDGFVDSVFSTYTNNVTNWHLGRLNRVILKRNAPNTAPIARISDFEYSPSTGILTKEILNPTLHDTLKIEKYYNYDTYGNKVSERMRFMDDGVWKTRGDSVVYDVRGRFIIKNINDLGHFSLASYNNLFGHQKLSTDPNGNTVKTFFDEFGRTRRTEAPDGTWMSIAYKRCNGDCPPQAVTYTEESSAIGKTSKSFFDRFGREIRSEDSGFNGQTIYTENIFNHKGYLIATTDPFYEGETKRYTNISYDKLGREIIREETGNQVSTKRYYGLGIKVTNPKGQTSESYTYANGKLKYTIDNLGKELHFRYDAQGNTIKVILPTGHEIISEYNIISQQTKLIDPDMGIYTYRYNAIGELKYQKDPKGNEVFMKYDTLGRLINKKELEDVTIITYDTAVKGIGMMAAKVNKLSENAPDFITSYSYTFDQLSRPASIVYRAEGDPEVYTLSTQYDNLGRTWKINYPVVNGITTRLKYEYNEKGYHTKIIDDISNVVYWQLDSITSQGQINQYTLGNGNIVKRQYDMDLDYLNGIFTKSASGDTLQNLQYDYDIIGNLNWRKDWLNGLTEHFQYDGLNRLTQSFVVGMDTINIQYDMLGNITSKSDLGEYHYNQNGEGPHVLTSIDLYPGRCLPSHQTQFVYNSFNKTTNILASTGYSMQIKYSVDKQRYRQEYFYKNEWLKQKDFILDLIEREKTPNGERTTFYIKGDEGVIAAKYHSTVDNSVQYQYWLKDHLGSLQTIVGPNDTILAVLSFDAWGQRRYADGSPMPVGLIDSLLNDRGYTGHEHLDLFDLINMNGRIYDPILARFTTPDPFIQEVGNIQSYNRFSYVLNNPLSATDPSGYILEEVGNALNAAVRPFKKAIKRFISAFDNIANGNYRSAFKDFGQSFIYFARGVTLMDAGNHVGVKTFGKDNWNTIVVTAATIAVSAALGPGGAALGGFWGSVGAGAAGGFVGGASGTILAGGDFNSALKAGLKGAANGALSAGLTYRVGQMAAAGPNGYTSGAVNMENLQGFAVKVVGHGVVQGAMSDMQGGNFGSGFMSGSMSAGVQPLIGGMERPGKIMTSALVGGVSSSMSGGKFANGAISGAMVYLFNSESLLKKLGKEYANQAKDQAVDYLNTVDEYGSHYRPPGWKPSGTTIDFIRDPDYPTGLQLGEGLKEFLLPQKRINNDSYFKIKPIPCTSCDPKLY